MSKSALQLLARANSGLVPFEVGTGPIPPTAVRVQGLWVNDGKVVAVKANTVVGEISYANGLPYDSNGRLIFSEGVLTHYSQGLPFAALGLFVKGSGSENYYSNGLLFSDGGLGVEGLAPLPEWVNEDPWINEEAWP